jgi:hypothetical protein
VISLATVLESWSISSLDPLGVPGDEALSRSKVFLEIGCGAAKLSKAVLPAGAPALGIDWKLNRQAPSAPSLVLDITEGWAYDALSNVIRSLVFAAWFAIPCGTLSAIRERPVSEALKKRGVPDAPPLRSAFKLWGLDSALADPKFAKRLHEANSFIVASFNLILLCIGRAVPWFVENPLNSLLWQFHFWKTVKFTDCDYTACMHGAGRPKKQRIRFCSAFGGKAAFLALALECDGMHDHKPWGPVFDGAMFAGFATQDEAAYPTEFCRKVARLIVAALPAQGIDAENLDLLKSTLAAALKPVTKDANKLKCAANRATVGQQARGRTLA